MRRWAIVALLSGVSACSGNGCASLPPLPAPMPTSQTIEGGVQVRMTQGGLDVIGAAARDLVNSLVAGGVCLPEASQDLVIATIYACYKNQCGPDPACNVNVTLNSIDVRTQGSAAVRLDVNFNGSTTVPLKIPTFLGDITCDLGVTINGGHLIGDVNLGINGSSGELTLALGNLSHAGISPQFNICDLPGFLQDIIGGIADFIFFLTGTDFGDILVGQAHDPLAAFVQGLLPSPLGLQGMLDVGALLSGFVAGIESKIELKAVLGGYARTPQNGVSVGLIVGLNADRDPQTRGAAASEPARCMPAFPAPDFTGVLDRVPGRNNFMLPPAGPFLGDGNLGAHVAFGLSQTLLDLAGHHVLSSGALCVSVGSAQIPQLNLGTLSLLIPSLAGLGTGKEPILVKLRPQKPLRFEVGTGEAGSPFLNAHLDELEVDLYALVYERYARALTLSANVTLGLNVDFMLQDGKAVLIPTLVGLSPESFQVMVTDADFVAESPEQLEAIFPTILGVLIPLLSGALPAFPVPEIPGFTIDDLSLARVDTPSDHFLGVNVWLARPRPLGKDSVVDDGTFERPLPPPAETSARVARVTTPSAEAMRTGALPEVELALGGRAADGKALEWQWSLNGGLWRPFSADARPVVRDPALALQGRHTLRVRARAAGDYRTTDIGGVALPVLIDSEAPRLLIDEARADADGWVVPATDRVSESRALLWAAGPVGSTAPATPWAAVEGHLARAELEPLANARGQVQLFVKDEAGNVATAVLDARLFAVEAGEGGGCNHGGAAPLSAMVPLLALLAWRGRRGLLALLLFAACSSSGSGTPTPDAPPVGPSCTTDDDCTAACPGKIGLCLPDANNDKHCVCRSEVEIGPIGAYTSLAVGETGTAWVAAYNQLHGDLMVSKLDGAGHIDKAAWEFVDGVPAGPVVVPGSTIRGGIAAPGDDVGVYTSIALSAAGEPMVAHYDRTHRALKLSMRSGGVWTSHTVDARDGADVGRYTSISLDSQGRPGIAYLTIIRNGDEVRSEVRWAQARTATPTSAADWHLMLIEAAAAPPANLDLDDVPNVVGVFVTSARTPDGSPVVAYYDRPAGRLKMAETDIGTGMFAEPVVVAARAGRDWGAYPSLAIDADSWAHLTFVDSTKGGLWYFKVGGAPELIDDGYREDGTNGSGLARPVFHLVGHNANLIVAGSSPSAVVYQDSTSHQLMLARRGQSGWTRESVAGGGQPFTGAYGFFAAARANGTSLVMASYAMNLKANEVWVEVFRSP